MNATSGDHFCHEFLCWCLAGVIGSASATCRRCRAAAAAIRSKLRGNYLTTTARQQPETQKVNPTHPELYTHGKRSHAIRETANEMPRWYTARPSLSTTIKCVRCANFATPREHHRTDAGNVLPGTKSAFAPLKYPESQSNPGCPNRPAKHCDLANRPNRT